MSDGSPVVAGTQGAHATTSSLERSIETELVKFEHLLHALDGKPTQDEVATFPASYRRLCQLLALGKQRSVRGSLVDRLNTLAVRGHATLYRERRGFSGRGDIEQMLLVSFPRAVRGRWRPFLLATALYVATFLVTSAVVRAEPARVYNLVSPSQVAQFEAMYGSASTLAEARSSDTNLMMFGFYIRHNVGIDLQVFGAGLLAGVGTLFALIFNGLVHGAVFAHVDNIGYGHVLYAFAVGHSGFELLGMLAAASAGLRMGLSWLVPGNRTRLLALREEATACIPLLWGCMAMTTLAAFIEAFWSPVVASEAVRYGAGGFLWLLAIAWLALGGTRHAR